MANPNIKAASVKQEVKKESAREKIESILKKRERKMESKANQ